MPFLKSVVTFNERLFHQSVLDAEKESLKKKEGDEFGLCSRASPATSHDRGEALCHRQKTLRLCQKKIIGEQIPFPLLEES